MVRSISEKRVTAAYKSKLAACSSTSQSEHQNKLGYFFNIFKYPAKFSVSYLRNGSVELELAEEQDCSSSVPFQIMCVWAPLDYLYFWTPTEGQSGDYS